MFCAMTMPVLVATTLFGEMGPPRVRHSAKRRITAGLPPGFVWLSGTDEVVVDELGVELVVEEAKELPWLVVTTTTATMKSKALRALSDRMARLRREVEAVVRAWRPRGGSEVTRSAY